jgi:hypothetical protein
VASDAAALPVPALPGKAGLPPAVEESQPERPDRIVSGKRYEAPMKIRMILDSYRFKGSVVK